MNGSSVKDFLKELYHQWRRDKVSRLASSLAYFTIFSLAPLILLLVGAVGLVTGEDFQESRVLGEVESVLGTQGAELVQSLVENIQQSDPGILATVIGAAGFIYGATSVFSNLYDSLNTVWDVAPKGSSGQQSLRKRGLAFIMMLIVGLMLLVAVLADALVDNFANGLTQALPGVDYYRALEVASIALIFLVSTILIAMVYKWVPEVEITWKDVAVGALVTGGLFTAGHIALRYYFGEKWNINAYDVSSALVAFLLWLFYSANIVFLGAEFTKLYAEYNGRTIQPNKYAVRLTPEARIREGVAGDEDTEAAERRQTVMVSSGD